MPLSLNKNRVECEDDKGDWGSTGSYFQWGKIKIAVEWKNSFALEQYYYLWERVKRTKAIVWTSLPR